MNHYEQLETPLNTFKHYGFPLVLWYQSLRATYQPQVANKDSSKREWAFNRVDAVLEFASPEAAAVSPFTVNSSKKLRCFKDGVR